LYHPVSLSIKETILSHTTIIYSKNVNRLHFTVPRSAGCLSVIWRCGKEKVIVKVSVCRSACVVLLSVLCRLHRRKQMLVRPSTRREQRGPVTDSLSVAPTRD